MADKPRVVHLALKVADLECATRFYEDVFGFRQTGTGHARGHVSRHMTDGAFDLALMVYDSEDVHEAQLSGPGPCIHHWGIEVPDREATAVQITANGGAIISDPKEGALKFQAPDGAVAEIVRAGRYRKASSGGARIRGLSIETPDSRAVAQFYQAVFGFEEISSAEALQLTDGSFRVSLLQGYATTRAAHHHWTVEVNEPAGFAKAIGHHGGMPAPGKKLLYRAPDGSLIEIVAQ